MRVTLAIVADIWSELITCLEDASERAAVLSVAIVTADDETVLLVRSIAWVPNSSYVNQDSRRVTISSSGFVPQLKRAADDHCGALFFHSHPGGDPQRSSLDLQVDDELSPVFRLRTGQAVYASLVLGGTREAPRFDAHLRTEAAEIPIDAIRVVGNRMRFLLRDQGSKTEPSRDSASWFDRQVLAFGQSGQDVLSRLHVGVIGAGGTGSSVSEQLIRLGVGRLTVVDDDVVEQSNVSRVYGTGAEDVGVPKVDVIARQARRIGTGTAVTTLLDRITRREAVEATATCDVIFGCTDDNAGRGVLSRMAYWFLAPVIDIAFVVDSSEGQVRGLYGRVTYVAAGTACLVCRGRIDPEVERSEFLSPSERDRLRRQGYVPELAIRNPAVVPYTTLVASLAVSELLRRILQFGDGADDPTELIVLLTDRELRGNKTAPDRHHYCADRENWGRGFANPLLGRMWA